MSDTAPDRKATERARYIAQTTELTRSEAEVLAWSELGYSHSGIAKQADTSESTVKAYLERAGARYGLEALWAKIDFDRTSDLTPVEPGYHRTLKTEEHQRQWIDLVDRQRDSLPAEWVNDVLDAAEDDGLRPEIA